MDYPFKSDGCTLVPDYDQNECCVRHDWLYWQGGPLKLRREADDHFYECVRTTNHSWLAPFRWFGVLIGGLSFIPSRRFRWGYGWKWPRYKAPKDDSSPYTVENQREVFERVLQEARERDQRRRNRNKSEVEE